MKLFKLFYKGGCYGVFTRQLSFSALNPCRLGGSVSLKRTTFPRTKCAEKVWRWTTWALVVLYGDVPAVPAARNGDVHQISPA